MVGVLDELRLLDCALDEDGTTLERDDEKRELLLGGKLELLERELEDGGKILLELADDLWLLGALDDCLLLEEELELLGGVPPKYSRAPRSK